MSTNNNARFPAQATAFLLALLLGLLFGCPLARAEQETAALAPSFVWSLQTSVGTICVRSDLLEEESWLFLPSCADLSALTLTVDGQTIPADAHWQGEGGRTQPCTPDGVLNLPSIAQQPEEGVYRVTLEAGGESYPLNVMKSAYLPALYLYSDDPLQQGREWLEDCPAHEKSTSAALIMLQADGKVSACEEIEKLRGRGNSTWEKAIHKKPYQIKLKYKRDLLDSTDPKEANKKWVLLSNEAILTDDADLSMLRNQIALDLGKEFGLSETPRCQQVDLYYDDCYRGTYLLCEKVEVNEGRLEIADYDELLKKLAKGAGLQLEQLPATEGQNSYGQPIHYTQDVPEPQDIQSAGYLIEMERGTDQDGTVSDAAWFTLSNGQNFALKNPSYGGVRAVTFASELMEEVYRRFQNYGFDPDTGAPLDEIMDIPSFTKSFLMQEITQNNDAYLSTSTNFVILPGERKLYAGPIWDFDLTTGKVAALRDNCDWARFFYRTTVFQQAAKEVYPQQLYPLLQNILLGTESGEWLKPLTQYEEELEASWSMDYHRFFAEGYLSPGAPTLHSYIERLRSFYDQQSEWLLEEIAAWSEDETAAEIEICLESPIGDITQYMTATVENELHAGLHVSDLSLQCIREASLYEDGRWQAVITVSAKPDGTLQPSLTVRVNGVEAEALRLDASGFQVTVCFDNPLYRPAVYDGVDYGLVFHYEYFADNYPDILEECGGTLEGALAYYCQTGMDEGLICSDYFDPTSIPLYDQKLEARYQDDWRDYIQLFLDWQSMDMLDPFVPEVEAAD